VELRLLERLAARNRARDLIEQTALGE